MTTNRFFRSRLSLVSARVIAVLSVMIGLLILGGDHGVPRVTYTGSPMLSARNGQFVFRFSRLMDEKSVEDGFRIVPPVSGKFSWIGRTFAFTSDTNLVYGERYDVTFATARDLSNKEMPLTTLSVPVQDQSWFFLGTQAGQAGRVMHREQNSAQPTAITPAHLFVQQYAISPDGSTLALLATERSKQTSNNRTDFRLMLWDRASATLSEPRLNRQWIVDNLTWLPDSSAIAFSYIAFQGPLEGIAQFDLTREEVSLLADKKARAFNFAFTPDGSQLLYIDVEGAVFLRDLESAEDTLVTTVFNDIVGFDASGEYLAYTMMRSVESFDLTNVPVLLSGSGTELRVPVPPSSSFDINFLPGKSQIIWTVEQAIGDIRQDSLYLYDYKTNVLTPLEHRDNATDIKPAVSADGQQIAWLRFYNDNKGYILSGWNDYQHTLVGGEIWLYDMLTKRATNTGDQGAEVQFLP